MEASTSSIAVTPSQLSDLLTALLPAREPVLIHGAPGIGKSQIVQAAAARLGYQCYVENLVSRDPTDIGGLPMILEGKPEHVHFKIGRIVTGATEPTLVFFDDLHNGMQASQAAVMQWVLDIAGNVSPHVSFVLACNGLKHRAGGSAIIETLKGRSMILELATRLDDWQEWALQHGISPRVCAFLRFRPGLLHDFKPTADLTNSPTPRGWARLDRAVKAGLPRALQLPAYAGCVGEGAATEYVTFERVYESIIPPDVIFASPDSAPIPRELSSLYATALALAHAVTPDTMGPLGRYLERLLKQHGSEMPAVTLSTAITRDRTLTQCRAYIEDISCGPLGRVLIGTSRA